jgi:hypothetical protein
MQINFASDDPTGNLLSNGILRCCATRTSWLPYVLTPVLLPGAGTTSLLWDYLIGRRAYRPTCWLRQHDPAIRAEQLPRNDRWD